uniref:(northern house mosquito) hypothetical protein n=1 Tax=Culex pipiens TaxID=7175 RepID=A0A8D8BJZ1_CULPI
MNPGGRFREPFFLVSPTLLPEMAWKTFRYRWIQLSSSGTSSSPPDGVGGVEPEASLRRGSELVAARDSCWGGCCWPCGGVVLTTVEEGAAVTVDAAASRFDLELLLNLYFLLSANSALSSISRQMVKYMMSRLMFFSFSYSDSLKLLLISLMLALFCEALLQFRSSPGGLLPS